MSENEKPWFLSKTIIGSVITGVVALAGIFGLELNDLSEQITTAVFAVIGVIFTIYGRITAKKKLK